MAYEKTTWVSGDVITAENMNKIEDELATLDEKGDSIVSFELGDRIAKGVDSNGNVVDGAVIEGVIKDIEAGGGKVPPKNVASGLYSHAEGSGTTASGGYSHAEGSRTTASGDYSHAEGSDTKASGDYSHAEGSDTKASGDYQHVQGRWNVEDTSNTYAHIVGGGTKGSDRKNIHTLDWSGNAYFAGNLTLGGTTLTEEQLKKLIALLN